MTGSCLREPAVSPLVRALYDQDLADGGYVRNGSRLWVHQPETLNRLFELMSQAFTPSGLNFRQRGVLVAAAASALGDSYCSLAWGGKLGKASDAAVAAGVLNGSDAGLTDQEKAMAAWARKVAKDPNATTPAHIQALRDAGLDAGQIFAITAFVALRLAFATINDSLGAQPDAQLVQSLPQQVREAVTYGRCVAFTNMAGSFLDSPLEFEAAIAVSDIVARDTIPHFRESG
jgi:alkylhydroperoxidase family enzyme